jgi:hypothetical protein
VHGLVDLDSVLYCIFSCLNEARLGLVARFLILLLAQLVEFSNGDTLLFDALLPYFKFLVLFLLLALPLLLLLLHAEDLD